MKYLIVCLIVIQANIALGQSSCEQAFRGQSPLEVSRTKLQQAWDISNFSDPNQHDSKKFTYLVHASPYVRNALTTDELYKQFLFGNSDYDFNEKRLFDVSVINENHTATFNRFGFILSVPKEKIMAATSKDMNSHGSQASTEEQIEKRAAMNYRLAGLSSPNVILQNAKQGVWLDFDETWTDVLVYGKANSPEKIKTQGLFYHIDSLGNRLVSSETLELLKHAGKALKLPIVRIGPPSGEFVISADFGKLRPQSWGNRILASPGPSAITFLTSRTVFEELLSTAKANGKKLWAVSPIGARTKVEVTESLLAGEWLNEEEIYNTAGLPPELRKVKIVYSER